MPVKCDSSEEDRERAFVLQIVTEDFAPLASVLIAQSRQKRTLGWHRKIGGLNSRLSKWRPPARDETKQLFRDSNPTDDY